LADLAARLKLGKQEEERWTNLKQHLTNVLLEELWDGDSFLIKNALTGETRKSTSLLRLMPLVAARHLPVDVVEKMSTDLSKQLTQWGLATEELESSLYEADGYWRGPIWAPTTLLIESGLRMAGRTVLANSISERFIKMCEKAGFCGELRCSQWRRAEGSFLHLVNLLFTLC
jgi:glycogen debranching enzyme